MASPSSYASRRQARLWDWRAHSPANPTNSPPKPSNRFRLILFREIYSLQFLREHGEAAVRVAEILSKIYHATLSEVRYLGFSSSTTEKLARFLLDLPVVPGQGAGHLRATLTLTHKEIGEMIGASRETVTRLFSHFKRERLIEVHGSTLIIADKAAPRKVAARLISPPRIVTKPPE